jgi:uncharacterized protein (DUF1697 family)
MVWYYSNYDFLFGEFELFSLLLFSCENIQLWIATTPIWSELATHTRHNLITVRTKGGGNQVHLLKSSEKAEILAWKQNNVVKFIDGVQVCALEPKWGFCIAC